MDDKETLKTKYLEYYSELPLHNLASAKIGRSVPTTSEWRKQDQEFESKLEQAKADWALKRVKLTTDHKWLLGRIIQQEFAEMPLSAEGVTLAEIISAVQKERNGEASTN